MRAAIIIPVTVQTSKHAPAIVTRWEVRQEHPYPDIHANGGGLCWRNAPEMFREYGNAPRGMGNRYCYAMLRSDYDPATANNSRHDYAGYENAPGALTLRGQTLGEISGTVAQHAHQPQPWYTFTVRGYGNAPTPGERRWLEENVAPQLAAGIAANRDKLRALAIEAVRERVAQQITTARASLDKLEREAVAAIAAL